MLFVASSRVRPLGTLQRSVSAKHISSKKSRLSATSARPSSHSRRNYDIATSPPQTSYLPVETVILSAALAHIPIHGFTQDCLSRGALAVGYTSASTNLFPRGAFDLVLYHLATQRLALKTRIQFAPISPEDESREALGVGAKVRMLILERLRANEPVIHKYPEALALMSLASRIPTSLMELARLSDEIMFLAGDVSLDSGWYTKRAMLAGVYASAEVFMTQDKSDGFAETERFVDRTLEEARRGSITMGDLGKWVGHTGISAVNVMRSLGVRI